MLFQKAFKLFFNLNGCATFSEQFFWSTWRIDAPAKWILGPVDFGEECRDVNNCKDPSICYKKSGEDLGKCYEILDKGKIDGKYCYTNEMCKGELLCEKDPKAANYLSCVETTKEMDDLAKFTQETAAALKKKLGREPTNDEITAEVARLKAIEARGGGYYKTDNRLPWSGIPGERKELWKKIGYTEEIWRRRNFTDTNPEGGNIDNTNPTYKLIWEELSVEQKDAATKLDYTEEVWNNENEIRKQKIKGSGSSASEGNAGSSAK